MNQQALTGIAYDRQGPRGGETLVLIHAGVADRRMWDPQWPVLIVDRDVVRLDLRGYGGSTARPVGALSAVDDVLDTLDELHIECAALVGASFGAGVAVEVALTRPALVSSLLLVAPGGSLLTTMTSSLRAFFDTENAAMARGDLDAAVEANLICWVDGRGRRPDDVDQQMRTSVAAMQRRAFQVTTGWEDVEQVDMDPPPTARLTEIGVPTLVLVGGLDLDAIQQAAAHLAGGIPDARRTDWPDVAHLPSMERPGDLLNLLRSWLDQPPT